jgi:hypothetical protein
MGLRILAWIGISKYNRGFQQTMLAFTAQADAKRKDEEGWRRLIADQRGTGNSQSPCGLERVPATHDGFAESKDRQEHA